MRARRCPAAARASLPPASDQLTVLRIGAALRVGLFPGNTGAPHAIFAMVTFVAGGVAAISSARVTAAPFRFASMLLGAISLPTLGSYMLVGEGSPMAALGVGGLERWIVYPVILWVIAFGGYLSAGQTTPQPHDHRDPDGRNRPRICSAWRR